MRILINININMLLILIFITQFDDRQHTKFVKFLFINI